MHMLKKPLPSFVSHYSSTIRAVTVVRSSFIHFKGSHRRHWASKIDMVSECCEGIGHAHAENVVQEEAAAGGFDPTLQGHIPEIVCKKYEKKANAAEDVPQAEAAWDWFNSLGRPRYWVAPMVDQSELPFRLLCQRHGADAAYTPMLHARLFVEVPSYRAEHFTTCQEDRPVLAQFCANDPQVLLAAAKYVEPYVDGVDINLGCPQRIAKKGRYGAYLMENVPLIESMVRILAENLGVPVTVKIRRFPGIQDTIDYAARLEKAGASLVAIHGRLREQKKSRGNFACWETIAAVKASLRVPVLANGNVRDIQDADMCMDITGADGVMSAESLLQDPALFSSNRRTQGGRYKPTDGPSLLLEYCDLVDMYPTPYRMIQGHAFSLLGPWLSEFTDMRERLRCNVRDNESLKAFTKELVEMIRETGRDMPIPRLSKRQLAAMEAEAAKAAAIAEQEREANAIAVLDKSN